MGALQRQGALHRMPPAERIQPRGHGRPLSQHRRLGAPPGVREARAKSGGSPRQGFLEGRARPARPGDGRVRAWPLRRHTQPAADNADLIGQVSGQTYGKITAQDVALWTAETERMSLEGSRVFHSSDELGSTVGVSCDMCHPHAANTHPETYPKFQAQLGRVALLRDMINWCIQHPVRGKPLASDDPKMRALEAYVLAQRKGKALDYGRH
jgi:hypothetical protein